MSIETPQHNALISESPFELRKYNEYITANVIIDEANYNTATNTGFRKVADYIFGNNTTTAALLSFFLGGIGVHKFYLGKVGWGIIYLLFSWTWIPLFFGIFESVYYLGMSGKSFAEKYS